MSLQSRRPIPEYADITYSFNGGKSRYHSFQTKFDWRIGRDMTLLSSLTLSQTKDNGAGSLENPNGNFPAPQDFRNLDADFGLSAYHQPYNSTTSFVIDLPFGSGRRYMSNANAVTEAMLGGWMIAGINTVAPGRDGDADLHADSRRSRCPASSRTSAAPTTIARTSAAIRWCRKASATSTTG